MALSKLINRWSETITVQISSEANKYNQCTYTNSTVLGRLVQTEEEVTIKNGTKVVAKAKLYTTTELHIDDKVGDYKIIGVKECKDKSSVIQFYKYYLGGING
jgi:hypothetical protein